MRDLVVVILVLGGSLYALRQPWVGVIVWTWLSIMNPHRFSWGFAYDAPLAAVAAAATLAGLLITKERESPFKGAPVFWLFLFSIWMTLSWLLGFDPSGDYPQWNKVIKVYLMSFVGLMLLRSRLHIHALMWVSAGSIGVLAVKGGLFTIATGGSYRVWGPLGSFIHDNNEMALATIVTIPLLRFMQLQYSAGIKRHLFTVAMFLAAASALGSQSRGALIAIASMAFFLWWRGGSRVLGGVVIFLCAMTLLAFMPESWVQRMNSIGDYEEDRSALGRISAWWTAWGVASNHFFGGGFDIAKPYLVALYSPYPDFVHAAHSIYFQVLGNHGFIGLVLWMCIFISTFWMASWLRREGAKRAETKWCSDLGAMCQVALLGYATGGLFLSLSYFDLPYNIMMIVVLARCWLMREAWKTEEIPRTWVARWLALSPSVSVAAEPLRVPARPGEVARP